MPEYNLAAPEAKMAEVPDGFWQWVAGGLATAGAGAATMVGVMFRGSMDGIRTEVKALDERTRGSIDDIWEVINAEREAASQQRERNYERLSRVPTRDEMNGGFARLEALIKSKS